MANKPVRRRPPRTLPLPGSNDVAQGQDEQKAEVESHPPRKNRNSALIEKLQATLSPTALLPSPLSPGAGKPQLPFFPPHPPCDPGNSTSASKLSPTEAPASFEAPAESTVLLSVNKGRARHSIKRRPPSRRLRKSSGEEEEKTSSPVSGPTTPDGKENDVFEKQKVEKEEIDGTDSASATSEQQQDQEQCEASADSEQQPLTSTGGEDESKECVVLAENKETLDEEMKSEQPELDSSKEESIKQEPDDETAMEAQSEPATATDDKI
ncbi:duboraya isoform X2 [Neoarius graeffei]|uniref:duboraya isoform X2 n=1 Tax=Neoarius graeffei TaxID=443677 RepID=UPI00298CFB8B|nr:duboraya isoform X2 [Neoarius graeffei]